MTLIRKDTAMKVRLSPEMWDRLGAMAQQLQQSPAVLASLAVSEYVRAYEVRAGACPSPSVPSSG